MKSTFIVCMTACFFISCKENKVIKEEADKVVREEQPLKFNCYIDGVNIEILTEKNGSTIILDGFSYPLEFTYVNKLRSEIQILKNGRVIGDGDEPSLEFSGGNINTIIFTKGQETFEYPVDHNNNSSMYTLLHTIKGRTNYDK